jgi:hypothetical protein
MIPSKLVQRLVGFVMMGVSAGLTYWQWHMAWTEGYYYPKLATLGAAGTVIFLGVVLFPLDVARQEALHGHAKPQSFAEYPIAWKVWFFVSLAAGLGNWWAMANL